MPSSCCAGIGVPIAKGEQQRWGPAASVPGPIDVSGILASGLAADHTVNLVDGNRPAYWTFVQPDCQPDRVE